jgi:hypothetical protein
MTTELKPCPWCNTIPNQFGEALSGMQVVFCPSCYAYGPEGNTEQDAITAWNTRPIEAALTGERDVALAQVAKFTKDNDITHDCIERLVAESATLTGERDAAQEQIIILRSEANAQQNILDRAGKMIKGLMKVADLSKLDAETRKLFEAVAYEKAKMSMAFVAAQDYIAAVQQKE